jgi:16S rRNA (cytidine1402-2'-O)-methyltransferase
MPLNDSVVYLIPAPISEDANNTLSPLILDSVKKCQVFFVENERSARRFLKSIWKEMVIDDYKWYAIHKAEEEVIQNFIGEIKTGKIIGIISEAGCPGVADPGQLLIHAAQKQNAKVIPLVGPSSIILALMASGMNGQNFSFVGYLPIDSHERNKAIKDLEATSAKSGATQIFIETPYRNNQLFEAITRTCSPESRLCIASEITSSNEFIVTKKIADWKKEKIELHKKTVIFLIDARGNA